LLPFGGQNLIEACAAGVPVILGPHTYNFEEAAEQAIDCGAAIRVDNAQAAVGQALTLIGDSVRLEQMSEAATRFTLAHRGATEKTMQVLTDLLD
jgi:3-deoxy-D-manno-octulosonic-acid transferase